MITAGFKKDNQSQSVAQTKAILEAARNFNFDEQEVARAGTSIQFVAPMIADRDGKTPLQQMNDSNYKMLSDTMVDYCQYVNLVQYQEDVSNILK